MATKDAASLRKRAQIAKANKIMFLWVAGASIIVSASIVVGIMLVQKAFHQNKAISELKKTATIVKHNNERVPALQDQLRALGSNQLLLDLRKNDTDNALRVILDALPTEANPSAFGASLQNELLRGVTVETMQVMPSEGVEDDGTAPLDGGVETINFQFSVTGTAGQLKSLLSRLERSIRTIQIVNMRIESGDSQQTLTVEGRAFYQPATILELQNKGIPRK